MGALVIRLMSIIIAAVIGYLVAYWLSSKLSARIITTILFSIIAFVLSNLRVIPAGYVGVKVLFGKVNSTALHEGLHFVPFWYEVIKMPVRTQAYTMSSVSDEGRKKGNDAISVLTADGLQVWMDITVWYHLDPAKAPKVYRTIGVDYDEKILRPAVRTAIRDVAVKFTTTDIYSTKRQQVANDISKILSVELVKRGIVFEKLLLRNVILPTQVRKAIEQKIAAEQEAQKMEFVLMKEKKEAERKAIEAEGIAKAQKIIANSLTPKYLQWYYIQTLKNLIDSPNNSTIVLPFDKNLTPLLNVK